MPVRRHGVPGRPPRLSPEQVAEAVRRWDAGSATVVELADDFGVHRNIVRRVLFFKGLATRPPAVSKRGYHLSAETRAKQSVARKAYWARQREAGA